MKDYSKELIAEIDEMVALRSTLIQQSNWDDAYAIKIKLWEPPFCVKLFDRKNSKEDENTDAMITTIQKTEWEPRIFAKPEPQRTVVWEQLKQLVGQQQQTTEPLPIIKVKPTTPTIPFLLATVDNPHYRSRCEETIQQLQNWQAGDDSGGCSSSATTTTTTSSPHCFEFQPCTLLDIHDCPSIGVKKILYEGWRQKLIPQLIQLLETYSAAADPLPTANDADNDSTPNNFLLVGEDDIRIPSDLDARTLRDICHNAFRSHSDLDLLSLGHSWKALSNQKKRQADPTTSASLFQFLSENKEGAGVHASTLFAIRIPDGVHRLQTALEVAAKKKKQTHLDQFLFYSIYHDLNLALSDPPLVGWAEVEVTLTKSGSGHRRRGGGRFGSLPPTVPSVADHITWVRRALVEEELDS